MQTINHTTRSVIIIFCILLTGTPSTPAYGIGPRADTFYSFSEKGPFESMEIYLTWENAPSSSYIYPSFFFVFQQPGNPNPGGFMQAYGYMGIQLVGNAKKAIFSIWDTQENSGTAQGSSLTSWCDRFGGEGTGAHCIVDYQWIVGRTYKLRVKAFNTDSSGELWIGTILDTVTSIETTIGIIHVDTTDSFSGYGHLTGQSTTFLEYFGSANTCDGQPFSKVSWRGPFANSETYTASMAVAYKNECSSINTTTTRRPIVIQEGGSGVQSTTPYGTILWQPQLFLPMINY